MDLSPFYWHPNNYLLNSTKEEYDPMAGPDEFFAVSSIPRNLAAKVPLKVIRSAFLGEEIEDVSKIANPESLEEVRALGKMYI